VLEQTDPRPLGDLAGDVAKRLLRIVDLSGEESRGKAYTSGARKETDASYAEFHRRSIQDREGVSGLSSEADPLAPAVQRDPRLLAATVARWFVGGETNLCYNALDRHVAGAAATRRPWCGFRPKSAKAGLSPTGSCSPRSIAPRRCCGPSA